jgi:DNA-binding protein H-NS
LLSYRELKAQAEDLQRKVDEARTREVPLVVAEIKQKMAEYGISAADLAEDVSEHPMKRTKATREKGVAKYRDDKTGKVWTGHGRRPDWVTAALAEGKTLADFAV